VRGKGLAGRFRWLQGIDVEELDEDLGYWENKSEIESPDVWFPFDLENMMSEIGKRS